MNSRQLKTAIRLMRDAERRIQPDAAWVKRTRTDLLANIRHQAMKQSVVTLGQRVRFFVLAYIPRSTVDFVRGPVMAVVSVFAVVLGGSLASVSAAERSIPGDLLYSVKLATEQARILMEPEAPDQLRLKAEFAERRGEEIKQLAQAKPSPKQSQQIKDTADMLKKDLDAVKLQLHTVASQSSPAQAATAAKDVDQRSGHVADTIKDVRDTIPADAKQNILDVQVAAVNTSVKAVQVLIDVHNDPAAAQVVSTDELKRVVTERVQGLEAGLSDTAQKVADVTGQSVAGVTSTIPTASFMVTSPSTSSTTELIKKSVDQLEAAKASLFETRQLLQDDKLSDVKDRLTDAVQAISTAEKAVITAALPSVSATSTMEPVTTSATPLSSASSTVVQATTTVLSVSSTNVAPSTTTSIKK